MTPPKTQNNGLKIQNVSKVDFTNILGLKIHDANMMNHISSNLPEEYMKIVEHIEYDIDYTKNECTIQQLRGNIRAKEEEIRA